VGFVRIIRRDIGKFADRALITCGMNLERDFSFLTRKDGFIKIAG
jgi:hypothetical protein